MPTLHDHDMAVAEQGAAVAALKKDKSASQEAIDGAVAELLRRKADLKAALEEAGFEDVRRSGFGESRDEALRACDAYSRTPQFQVAGGAFAGRHYALFAEASKRRTDPGR